MRFFGKEPTNGQFSPRRSAALFRIGESHQAMRPCRVEMAVGTIYPPTFAGGAIYAVSEATYGGI